MEILSRSKERGSHDRHDMNKLRDEVLGLREAIQRIYDYQYQVMPFAVSCAELRVSASPAPLRACYCAAALLPQSTPPA